jgi:hypothetical protein
MPAATAIAMAYRSAVAKPSAKFQAASQLPQATCGAFGSVAKQGVREAPRAYLAMKIAAMSGR